MLLDKPAQLFKGDCLDILKQIPANTFDAIITDPPYFKVKANDWDQQWNKVDLFFSWLDAALIEFKRVLKPTGSLYLFCSDKLAAQTELLIAKHFNVLNHLVWLKTTGKHNQMNKAIQRKYFSQTERIIFAEQQMQRTNKYYCAPILDYLCAAWIDAGLKFADAEKLCGSSARHYFTKSQWALPTEQKYALMQQHAPKLTKSWYDLKAELTDNLNHFGGLRSFTAAKGRMSTDVIACMPVQYYEGKHPCEKPQQILDSFILNSTRVNDLILDPFAGSCSTGIAALNHGRRFVGIDLDDSYFSRLSI